MTKKVSPVVSTKVWTPFEIEEAWKKKQHFGADACFVSGGTLLQTQWEKGAVCPEHLISLEKIQAMKGISKELDGDRTVLRIGALTTLAACRAHPFIEETLLAEAIQGIAAPAIRNRATIGGNVASGYGDAIPALLAMDAEVSLFDGTAFRTEMFWDWLQRKNTNQMEDDTSLLVCIYVPERVRAHKTVSFYKKIGRREAFSPALVVVSVSCCWNKQGEITHIRLAAGGGENSPQRLLDCEQLLQGSIPTQEMWEKVYKHILIEFQPISDAFASADYRRRLVANISLLELTRIVE